MMGQLHFLCLRQESSEKVTVSGWYLAVGFQAALQRRALIVTVTCDR